MCICLDETDDAHADDAFSQSNFSMFVALVKNYRFFMSFFKKSEIGNFSVNKSELGYPETYFGLK